MYVLMWAELPALSPSSGFSLHLFLFILTLLIQVTWVSRAGPPC